MRNTLVGKNTNLVRFWQTSLRDLASECINLADFLQESCKICVILEESCKVQIFLQDSFSLAASQDILAIETVIPFKTEKGSMLKNFLFCLEFIRCS